MQWTVNNSLATLAQSKENKDFFFNSRLICKRKLLETKLGKQQNGERKIYDWGSGTIHEKPDQVQFTKDLIALDKQFVIDCMQKMNMTYKLILGYDHKLNSSAVINSVTHLCGSNDPCTWERKIGN